MLPTSDSLRDAITRMLEWDEDANRDLAQANADALLEKNQDVKAKRVEGRRVYINYIYTQHTQHTNAHTHT